MQALETLLKEEKSTPWSQIKSGELADLLFQVAENFYIEGDFLVSDTAAHMGVTPTSVWFEVIFPSVWGLLSTATFLNSPDRRQIPLGQLPIVIPKANKLLGKHQAVSMMPSNNFDRLFFPGFSGYLFLGDSQDKITINSFGGLALCLLPFNSLSIGVLDILHLLCHGPYRVVAKFSEKNEFLRPHLENIFSPLILMKALKIVEGGVEVGSRLIAQPRFDRIHLTGSRQTSDAIKKNIGSKLFTSELGGVTPVIIFPEVIKDQKLLCYAARQLTYGALANNGQHCVSYQVIIVPESGQAALSKVLISEMGLKCSAADQHSPKRLLIDEMATMKAKRIVDNAIQCGATACPSPCEPNGRQFPVTLITGITTEMKIFQEEIFGPIVGIMSLPDHDFANEAVKIMNHPRLLGDLGASLYTANPDSEKIHQTVCHLKHGIIGINCYPGLAFATSLPWGAGVEGSSGKGWVHNYQFLTESYFHKVVIKTSLKPNGFGFIKWEDPWLHNVSNQAALRLAKSIVNATIAFFKKQSIRFMAALIIMLPSLVLREIIAYKKDCIKE